MWWRLTSRLASRAMSFALRTRLALPRGPMVRNSQGWIFFPTTHLFWVLLSPLPCLQSWKWSSKVLHEAISFFEANVSILRIALLSFKSWISADLCPFLLESWTIGAEIKLVFFCFKRIFFSVRSNWRLGCNDRVSFSQLGLIFISELFALFVPACFFPDVCSLSLLTLFLCLFTVTLPHWSMFTALLRVISIMVRCMDILLWTLTVLSNHSSLSLMWTSPSFLESWSCHSWTRSVSI